MKYSDLFHLFSHLSALVRLQRWGEAAMIVDEILKRMREGV
jgi:hypothetical protein